MLEFKEVIHHIIPMLPIVGAGVIETDRRGQKLSTAGMVSRVLELGIVGGFFIYATVQVMDAKLNIVEKFADKHEQQYHELRDEVKDLKAHLELMAYKLQDHVLEDTYRRGQGKANNNK